MKKVLKVAGITTVIAAGVAAVVFVVKAVLDYREALEFISYKEGHFEDDDEEEFDIDDDFEE